MSCSPSSSPVTGPSPMKGVSPTSVSQDFGSPHPTQHRKSVSTGGGRAWSQEEENYLIETRMHKMPYKHIATTLKKTELACRLHYHQLSFGNKRHRRTASVTSTSYAGSPITPAEGLTPVLPRQRPQQQQPLPSMSMFPSPETPRELNQDIFKSPQSHIPILPKPHFSRPAPPSMRGLRLITEGLPTEGAGVPEKKSLIDNARLDKIYNARRLHFWSTIARDYGSNVSPTTLEQAWCKAHRVDASNYPPTPSASPDDSSRSDRSSYLGAPFSAVTEYSQGFTSINNPMPVPKSAVAAPHARSGSFAIANLLTEDKEVRSPVQEKKARECEMVR
ncbi:MAG: hypothetical protein Q9218_002186 [Villophora microphyllina]